VPIFEFQCKKCSLEYEELVPYDKTGKYKTVRCPACNSLKKEKIVSNCAFNFTNPIGTDRWNSTDQGHDYRFNWNKPNVAKQRQMAEKMSHMGTKPYADIDDISSGKHFGEVK